VAAFLHQQQRYFHHVECCSCPIIATHPVPRLDPVAQLYSSSLTAEVIDGDQLEVRTLPVRVPDWCLSTECCRIIIAAADERWLTTRSQA
jgi:hypothetical protein